MARRILLPALRGLESKSLHLPAETETKSLGGGVGIQPIPGYSSLMTAGGLGDRDRAAGWDLNGRVMDAYEKGVWTFKCVEYIAGHQSRLPFRIGADRGTQSEKVLDEHPLYRVMNRQANPAETGRQFRKRLSAQLLLSKRGVFVEVTKSRAGTVTRLDLLDPTRCRPVPNDYGDDYIKHFEYFDRNGAMREIDPERIRWIRDPHPIDPFCGITPLEAAGISIQLDALSRRYNINFINQDGRPGGLVGIDADGLDDGELERIDRIFAPGVMAAGEIKVVGTGPGGLNYVDTSTKPRDMAYSEASQNSKTEILSAFGLGESLFGNAAGRTFDNAEQEKYNAWSETLLPHFDLVASAFDRDVDEDFDPFIDTRSVDVLEIPRRKRREEALQEWNAGLRSLNEYRPLAGLPELDNAFARAVWISPSKAPVPGRAGDEAALGLAGPADGEQPGATPTGVEVTAAQTVLEARGELPPGAGPAAAAVAEARNEQGAPPGSAAEAVDAARAAAESSGPGEAAAAVDEARGALESKALDPGAAPLALQASPDALSRLELAVGGALDAMAARQAQVLTARIESPKARKGTRFWTPENAADARGGERPIDTADVIQVDRWVEETEQTVRPLVEAAATDTAATLLAGFAAGGVLAGVAQTAAAAELAQAGAQIAQETVEQTVQGALAAMRSWLRTVQRQIEVEQLVADRHEQLVEVVKQAYADNARAFASGLAERTAVATVNGVVDAVTGALLPLPGPDGDLSVGLTRTWRTQGDSRVRPSHRDAEGIVAPAGVPFEVGGALLDYPGDPAGPLEQTAGCRCWLQIRVSRATRLLMPPVNPEV